MDQKSKVFGEKKDDDFSFLYESADTNELPDDKNLESDVDYSDSQTNVNLDSVNEEKQQSKDDVEAFFAKKSEDTVVQNDDVLESTSKNNLDKNEIIPILEENNIKNKASEEVINEDSYNDVISNDLYNIANNDVTTTNDKTQNKDDKNLAEVALFGEDNKQTLNTGNNVENLKSDNDVVEENDIKSNKSVIERNIEQQNNDSDIKVEKSVENNAENPKKQDIQNKEVVENKNDDWLKENNITDKNNEVLQGQSDDLPEGDKKAPKSEISRQIEQQKDNIQDINVNPSENVGEDIVKNEIKTDDNNLKDYDKNEENNVENLKSDESVVERNIEKQQNDGAIELQKSIEDNAKNPKKQDIQNKELVENKNDDWLNEDSILDKSNEILRGQINQNESLVQDSQEENKIAPKSE
ncbi:MAG: hypothetical protein PHY80_01825, partial [Rickettsiales bacterium]|nr:hypothetical protein [Rickettsiales bacterium]